MTRVAAIDCGTNSIRLLVADGETQGERVILNDLTRQMRIVRLGQGVDRTGRLAPEAIERTLAAVREYKRMIDNLGATDIRFVSTSAMRDAENRQEFIEPVKNLLGVYPEVVPGTEEAALSFAGAASSVHAYDRGKVLVVDIGGGSTEMVVGTLGKGVDAAYSADMGSVRVTEKFFAGCASDQPIPDGVQAQASEWIDARLDEAEEIVDFSSVRGVVGVAGTITTIAAHALGLASYQPEKIDGAFLSHADTDASVRFMLEQPLAVKAALGFMPEGRADVIAGGALIWTRVMDRVTLRCENTNHPIVGAHVSEHDILDGIALSMLARR